MKRFKDYWRRLDGEGKEKYAKGFKCSKEQVNNKYMRPNPLDNHKPGYERMELMRSESNGNVDLEGLAYDFVIEPVTELARKKKALASEG